MNQCSKIDLAPVSQIVQRFGTSRDACIPILQAVQSAYGYLPVEAIDYITANTTLSRRQVYGVASFYGQFRFNPSGRHLIRVCQGTACHVNGSEQIAAALQDMLHVHDQETTADGQFTLETVACLGCCSLAPVMMIDETTYGRLDRKRVRKAVRDFNKAEASTGKPDE